MSAKHRWVIPAYAETCDFIAQRYRENKDSFTLDKWSTRMTKFGALGGLKLPVRGKAVCRLLSGDLPYADLELSEIESNGPIGGF